MTERPTPGATAFPEELLSGYLDGALTQQEEQRVRLHLERSAEARALLAELGELRQASRATRFAPAEDLQWSERARSPLSAAARWLGFTMLVVWLLGAAVAAAWQASQESMTWWEGALLVTGAGGVLLLFFSVLWDRLRDLPGDRYRRVLK
jgi:predicted anti-sigma-YlaC factor YlaD